jgi:hypothetical protein
MANGNNNQGQGDQGVVLVRATVILRIPDVDAAELTRLYQAVNAIVKEFGGEYNVDTQPQGQGLPPLPR